MKKIRKGTEPPLLAEFRRQNPNGTWKQCRKGVRKKQIQATLSKDQRGLCCYCEIDLRPSTEASAQDLRVEHFHPKSDRSRNWHLDWQNLFACCHGGSRRDIPDRFNSDHSCDVPKGEKLLDGLILNPLLMPRSNLFSFLRHSGAIAVNQKACELAGVDPVLVSRTIDELNLDTQRLRDLRKALLEKINDEIGNEIRQGQPVAEIRIRISERLFIGQNDRSWPSFFSALRDYLGKAAEERLISIGYSG